MFSVQISIIVWCCKCAQGALEGRVSFRYMHAYDNICFWATTCIWTGLIANFQLHFDIIGAIWLIIYVMITIMIPHKSWNLFGYHHIYFLFCNPWKFPCPYLCAPSVLVEQTIQGASVVWRRSFPYTIN